MIANVGNAMVGKGFLANLIGRITINIADLIEFKKHLTTKTIIPIHLDVFEHYRERDISEQCRLHGFKFPLKGKAVELSPERPK